MASSVKELTTLADGVSLAQGAEDPLAWTTCRSSGCVFCTSSLLEGAVSAAEAESRLDLGLMRPRGQGCPGGVMCPAARSRSPGTEDKELAWHFIPALWLYS